MKRPVKSSGNHIPLRSNPGRSRRGLNNEAADVEKLIGQAQRSVIAQANQMRN